MSEAGAGVRELYAQHVDRLHWLLRMAIPDRAAAEKALCETFVAAYRRIREPAGRRPDPTELLTGLAMEEIRRWNRDTRACEGALAEPAGSVGEPAGVIGDGSTPDTDLLGRMNDSTLSIIVRTLDPARRQALVLGVIYGLDADAVGDVIGCSPERLASLEREGLDLVRSYISLKTHEQREASILARKAAPHLKHVPVHPRGCVIIRGGRAYYEPGGILRTWRRAIERMVEFLRKKLHLDDLDDDVGDTGRRARGLDPTPTQRPFPKPKLTPSLQTYRNPETTRGTASYRTPKGTPSTARLSNPRRPLAVRSSAYSSWSPRR